MGCITGKIVSYGLDNGDIGGTPVTVFLNQAKSIPSRNILFALHIRASSWRGFSSPAYVFDDIVYFTADDGEHGKELWRSDGSQLEHIC